MSAWGSIVSGTFCWKSSHNNSVTVQITRIRGGCTNPILHWIPSLLKRCIFGFNVFWMDWLLEMKRATYVNRLTSSVTFRPILCLTSSKVSLLIFLPRPKMRQGTSAGSSILPDLWLYLIVTWDMFRNTEFIRQLRVKHFVSWFLVLNVLTDKAETAVLISMRAATRTKYARVSDCNCD